MTRPITTRRWILLVGFNAPHAVQIGAELRSHCEWWVLCGPLFNWCLFVVSFMMSDVVCVHCIDKSWSQSHQGFTCVGRVRRAQSLCRLLLLLLLYRHRHHTVLVPSCSKLIIINFIRLTVVWRNLADNSHSTISKYPCVNISVFLAFKLDIFAYQHSILFIVF